MKTLTKYINNEYKYNMNFLEEMLRFFNSDNPVINPRILDGFAYEWTVFSEHCYILNLYIDFFHRMLLLDSPYQRPTITKKEYEEVSSDFYCTDRIWWDDDFPVQFCNIINNFPPDYTSSFWKKKIKKQLRNMLADLNERKRVDEKYCNFVHYVYLTNEFKKNDHLSVCIKRRFEGCRCLKIRQEFDLTYGDTDFNKMKKDFLTYFNGMSLHEESILDQLWAI